ncbi:succinate dehydrogenase, hydrophobic membrane anchor protein [Methyloceanibacter sp.]|uniref:succinate dehydrogenase, hydrophobic membrane anchor protein n=1 Tax=Methyloceanibacter sp. TaxID=1965321 RepID=UPI00208487D8|nr:succinate dehydrogenase, hydrophobic membrane anchor protein [Methyloceanibacter sp.]GFO80462.1 MAG: succinate dehydrogenase, hydrophobic membrane anchor protein [Methyloceanibacter sp.]HML93205.1 succinate dehydrogenase, hydrophobic membrane anchor protein [Methyloceanibacter sp.]
MATPLKRIRGLGAAHHGTETFWRQRLTAVANVPLVIFLIWFVVSHAGASYDKVRECLANPVVAVLMLALIWSAAIHMRIGLREIIEDYVHTKMCKTVSLMAVTFFAALVGLASTLAILKISFGS